MRCSIHHRVEQFLVGFRFVFKIRACSFLLQGLLSRGNFSKSLFIGKRWKNLKFFLGNANVILNLLRSIFRYHFEFSLSNSSPICNDKSEMVLNARVFRLVISPEQL